MQCLKQWEQTHACARRPAEALLLADVGGSMRTPEADRCPANDVAGDVEAEVHRIPAERRPDPAAAGQSVSRRSP